MKTLKRLLPGRGGACAEHVYDHIRWLLQYLTSALSGKTFQIDGATYSYFLHPYNQTWTNERAVEIPVIREAVNANAGKRILEVGNVLSHYFPVAHIVVDKDERSSCPHILNVDFLDYTPDTKFDLIISISTVEHIGRNEPPGLSNKAVEADIGFRSLYLELSVHIRGDSDRKFAGITSGCQGLWYRLSSRLHVLDNLLDSIPYAG